MPIKLFRQRLIPKEINFLKDDIIVYHTPEMLITKWETLKPRSDFKYGFSCYYIYEGYKISMVYDENKNFLYTYIDIVTADIKGDTYVFLDMLVDIKIMPNGYVQVLDLDELASAYEKKYITPAALTNTIYKTDTLLKIIYSGHFPPFVTKLNDIIGENL